MRLEVDSHEENYNEDEDGRQQDFVQRLRLLHSLRKCVSAASSVVLNGTRYNPVGTHSASVVQSDAFF